MKKLLKSNYFKNYIILLIFTTILEISFRLISGIDAFDYSLLRIFIGLNFLSLILSFILSWFNATINKIGRVILCFIFSAYAFFQLGFNNFIGVYASVNTSSQLGAVTAYIKDFFSSFLGKYYLIFIPFIILLLYTIILDRNKNKVMEKKFILRNNSKSYSLWKTASTALALILIGVIYNSTLSVSFMQNDLQVVSNKELFKYPSIPSLAINEFGVLCYAFLDIKSLTQELPSNYDYIAAEVSNNNETILTREFDDTNWQELIASEQNPELNNINNYLINNNITDYNEYSGIFQDKNLIVIMMESVNEIFINEELYPNFYKLYTEGISFSNNYSPRNSCATGNNEFSGITSLYSIQNNCTANIYKNNTYFESLFNLFNKAGYKTSSMHNYTEAYYARRKIHTNLGSSAYYGVQDLGIPYYNEYRNWSSDEDFFTKAMDITLENTDEPFMLWLTTVSSHQPYKVSSVEGDKYLSITEGTDYPMDLRRYMSKLKTLDNALGILIDRLQEAGILDDTVIVLYGDHYPYGLKNDTINYIIDYDLSDYEVERTPMVIYNSTIEAEVVDKYSSYINLTPTLANLFALDYDPRYYMGMDIFSDDYLNLVVFADGSWKNNLAYYNASTSSITYYTDEVLDVEKIREINNIINLKMQVSTSIIKNNYFEYLENGLQVIENNKNTLASIGEETE